MNPGLPEIGDARHRMRGALRHEPEVTPVTRGV